MSARSVEIPNSPRQEETAQIKIWQGEFGRAYTDRNTLSPEQLDKLWLGNYGISRSEINREFLAEVPKDARILEVGCNVGNQLLALKELGFRDLTGVEIQSYAIEVAKKRITGLFIKQASAMDLPFESCTFDLVFTSGVLIHVAPEDLKQAISEIHRCTRQYIWGAEYFSAEPASVTYRGRESLLWKMDYAQLYLSSFADLRLMREQRLCYLQNENVDTVFLLGKNQTRET